MSLILRLISGFKNAFCLNFTTLLIFKLYFKILNKALSLANGDCGFSYRVYSFLPRKKYFCLLFGIDSQTAIVLLLLFFHLLKYNPNANHAIHQDNF